MSIVPLNKITLCGLDDEKDAVLGALQSLGLVHLVPLGPPPAEPEKAAAGHAEEAVRALKHLSETPVKRRPLRRDHGFDMDQAVEQVLANQEALRDLADQLDELQHRIEEREPWGDFSVPDRESLGGQWLWFYVLPLRKLVDIPTDMAFELVHRDNRFAYVVVVSPQEPPAEAMPVARSDIGTAPLSDLLRERDQLENALADRHAERESLTRWLFLMRNSLALADDRAALRLAGEQTIDRDGVFVVQGWVPVQAVAQIEAFAADRRLAVVVEAPGPTEEPPTLLANPRQFVGGEDVVTFFKAPPYQAWDPSIPVFISFAVFFAMIMADAGYALCFGAIVILSWRALNRSPMGRRLKTLGIAVTAASILFGALVGSWFGMAPPPDSPLGRLQILDMNDFAANMQLSIIVGVLHVCIANAAIAWSLPTWRRRLPPIGWVAAITGGLILWLGLTWLGTTLLVGGLAIAAVFASTRPLTDWQSGLMRVFDGCLELFRVTSAFGDILSYLRLFALGLAGTSLALTFNQLADDVTQALPGMGLLLAILILLAGHLLNFALCLMSGVVHGLRLCFIEFFNWGLPGEGRPYRVFAKKEMRT